MLISFFLPLYNNACTMNNVLYILTISWINIRASKEQNINISIFVKQYLYKLLTFCDNILGNLFLYFFLVTFSCNKGYHVVKSWYKMCVLKLSGIQKLLSLRKNVCFFKKDFFLYFLIILFFFLWIWYHVKKVTRVHHI